MPDILAGNPALSLTKKEQELAMAIAYLLKRAEKYGINDETQLEGFKSDGVVYKNKAIIEFAVEIYKVWASLFPHEYNQFKTETSEKL